MKDTAAQIEIRSVVAEDFDAIATITNEYVENTPIHFSTTPYSAEELRKAWSDAKDRFPYFVAIDESSANTGELVGFARAFPFRERAGYRFTAEVGLYVKKGIHGRGIGRALYTQVIETCRAQGYCNLVAGITLPNPASEGLHDAFGFQKVAHFPKIGWKLGAYHDVGFWQLTLQTPPNPAEVRSVDEVTQ